MTVETPETPEPDPRLVVQPEEVADEAGIPLPLSERDRKIVVGAILDAQADVDGYLGQSPLPTTLVQRGVWDFGGTWDLARFTDLDVIRVLSSEPEMDSDGVATGTFTITYLAGIDAREDEYRPIRRFIVAHAKNSPEFTTVWQRLTKTRGAVKTVSAEGQSVSFGTATLGGGGAAGSGAAGSLPTMASMDRWRVAGRRVHQGATHFGERYGL